MQGIIASLIITASMWIVGYSAKLILNTIERITGAQIQKGLLSSHSKRATSPVQAPCQIDFPTSFQILVIKLLKKENKENVMRKIAIYCRVSTEEQAKNKEGSITSQIQRLRMKIDEKNNYENGKWGKVASIYQDAAYSGKNTNRPDFKNVD